MITLEDQTKFYISYEFRRSSQSPVFPPSLAPALRKQVANELSDIAWFHRANETLSASPLVGPFFRESPHDRTQ